ncbi:MAG TPA: hypothetical protein PKC25_00870 [Candidatus Rifleibacterium sp.]|nr:hypothetical protein [Candidatus Rifleibacterium sp.]
MKATPRTILLLALLFCCTTLSAVEVRYAFRKGYTYSYQYTQQSTGKIQTFTSSPSASQPAATAEFTVKAIDFQDGAFIVDIGDKSSTYRRYLKENGEIKGAPAESGQTIPFFMPLPAGDWKVSEKRQIKKDLKIGDKAVPAAWNLLLKSVDNEKGLAEILFAATMKLPDDRLRQKAFSLKGRLLFNLFEGVVHQADWQTSYKFTFINKEFAVTRNLWDFEKQATHSLKMTGMQE